MPESLEDPTQLAVARWREALERASGRDSLINFAETGEETLDLAYAHPSGLAQFLAGCSTRLSSLFRQPSALITARRRARAIRLTSVGLRDRHGVHTAHLVSGIARFTARHDVTGEPIPVRAPILLHPVDITAHTADQLDEELHMQDEPRVNPALIRLLEGVNTTVDADEVRNLARGAHGFNPRPAYNYLRDRARNIDDFSISDRTVVGIFFDVLPALLSDFDNWGEQIANYPILQHLCSREAAGPARYVPSAQPTLPQPARYPDNTQVCLPLDDDQRTAAALAAEGRSLRVLAGPGFGSTQLVAQLVCSHGAEGRRVLVVTPRPREIEDLAQRCAELGFPGAVHDPGADNPDTIDLSHDGPPPPASAGDADTSDEVLADLIDRQHGMYTTLAPWGVNVYDALDHLTRLRRSTTPPTTHVRFSEDTMRKLSADVVPHVHHLLAELARQNGFAPEVRRSPWWSAMCAGPSDAQAALDAAQRLNNGTLARFVTQAADLAKHAGLAAPGTLTQVRELLHLLGNVNHTLRAFTDELYRKPLAEMVAATAEASWRNERGISMGMGERRRWRKAARSCLRPRAQIPNLHAALASAQVEAERWNTMAQSGGWPHAVEGVLDLRVMESDVLEDIDTVESAVATTPQGGGLIDLPLRDLAHRIDCLAVDRTTASLPERVTISGQLAAFGLSELLTDLGDRSVGEDTIVDEFDVAWWSSVLAILQDTLPLPQVGTDLATRWRQHRDVEHATFRSRVGASLANLPEPPCVAVTPLRMPELLKGHRFDLVVLLGAHSLAVPEAVLGLARAPQALIIGDPDGVHPRGLDDAVDGGMVRESVLDATADAIPALTLTCQHRMPRQVAELLPQDPLWSVAAPESGVTLVPVHGRSNSRAAGSDGLLADREIRAVVGAVMDHVHTTGDDSLAVVTLTRQHARHIADAVRAEILNHKAAADWFGGKHSQRFIVTDMHRCEDIVRDHVIVSLGITPTSDRPLPLILPEMDRPGAHAAVGAAFSRARDRVTVVSSVSAEDIIELVSPTAFTQALVKPLAATIEPRTGPMQPPGGVPPLIGDFAARLGELGFDVLLTGGDPGWPDLAVHRVGGRPVGVLIDRAWQILSRDTSVPAIEDTAAVVWDELAVIDHLVMNGWQVVRLSAIDVYADEDAALRTVHQAWSGPQRSVVTVDEVSVGR